MSRRIPNSLIAIAKEERRLKKGHLSKDEDPSKIDFYLECLQRLKVWYLERLKKDD
jgi:hypothetical protein